MYVAQSAPAQQIHWTVGHVKIWYKIDQAQMYLLCQTFWTIV